MKECKRKAKGYKIYKIEHKLPLKSSHKDGKHQFPPQSSKVRSIKRFGENISQPSLCVNVPHLDISLFHMISQEVVSHFEVFHSFVEDWVFGYRDGTSVIAHEGNSLKHHSKVSHGVYNP
jgi:hypothetical protein